MMITDIPQVQNWVSVLPINKGWSNDTKYFIETKTGEKLLLRISDIAEYDAKKAEYDAVAKMAGLSIPVSAPVEFGTCDQGRHVYGLYTWAEGEDAEAVVPALPDIQQYKLGVKAGQMLALIHTIPAPEGLPTWNRRMTDKITVRYEAYQKCGIKVPHDEELTQFIRDNIWCISGVNRTLCHGDYHLGNMIIDKDGGLHIIDFNRWGYEDPYEEFNRLMVFTRWVSVPFARGQIDGYFDGKEPPKAFFKRMAFYTAVNALLSIVWSIPFGEQAIQDDLARSQKNYDDYQGFTTLVPVWYEGAAQGEDVMREVFIEKHDESDS